MTEIIQGLGSMSAMIIIMSIIAIGAVMALRNKLSNKRLRRSQTQINLKGKRPSEGERNPADGKRPEVESDVNKELDDLKRDVDK